MSKHEPGQTPDEGRTETPDEARARVEALFERWDQDKPDLGAIPAAEEEGPLPATSRWQVDLFHLWVTLTAIIVILGCFFMWMTRHEVAYWVQRDAPPVEAGHLGERWAKGDRDLWIPSNTYVHLEGMFATQESEGEALAGERAGSITNFWIDPLYRIVVRTRQPFPKKPERSFAALEIDEAFVELLETRKAFPADLTVEISGTGRLLRASDVPRWHRDPILYYARLTRSDPHDLWLFIDGDEPEAYMGFAAVWAVALTAMTLALALLLRAVLRRRREG